MVGVFQWSLDMGSTDMYLLSTPKPMPMCEILALILVLPGVNEKLQALTDNLT